MSNESTRITEEFDILEEEEDDDGEEDDSITIEDFQIGKRIKIEPVDEQEEEIMIERSSCDALIESNPLQCLICEKMFYKENNLRQHVLAHWLEDTKPFRCHICKKRFSDRRDLKQHKNFHLFDPSKPYHTETHLREPDKPFRCEICLYKGFLNKKALNRHMDDNHASFTCAICNKGFMLRRSLMNHVSTHLPEDDKPLICIFCDKRFLNKKSLSLHMNSSACVKEFKWDKCPIAIIPNVPVNCE